MQTVKNQWNAKVAKYSLLASAALTMLNACGKEDEPVEEPNDPDIIETDIDPDISLAPLDSREFDLNNDGIMDITVGLESYVDPNQPQLVNIDVSYMEGMNGTELLTQEEAFTLQGMQYTEIVVTPLDKGNTISASQVVWDDFGLLGISGIYYGENISIGQFFGQDKYVGLRIPVAGNLHYAWMRLSVNNDGSSVTVKEYAFRETPNTPINAGDK